MAQRATSSRYTSSARRSEAGRSSKRKTSKKRRNRASPRTKSRTACRSACSSFCTLLTKMKSPIGPLPKSRTASVRRRLFAHLHRVGHRVHRQVVVGDLRHLVPVESGRVADRLLGPRGLVAIGDDGKPVT